MEKICSLKASTLKEIICFPFIFKFHIVFPICQHLNFFIKITQTAKSKEKMVYPLETICMKCQILFYRKNKKKTINLSFVELAQRLVNIKMSSGRAAVCDFGTPSYLFFFHKPFLIFLDCFHLYENHANMKQNCLC